MGNHGSEPVGPDEHGHDSSSYAAVDMLMGREVDSSFASQPASFIQHGAQNGHGSSARRGSSAASSAAPSSTSAAEANSRGVELLSKGQYDEAVREFKQALRHESGSVQILNNIGLAYAKMKDYNSAYEWYHQAYNQDRKDVETMFSLAWVERKRNERRHAQELFQKVLELQPDHTKALFLLGDILKTGRNYEGAARYFDRLIRHNPQDFNGLLALGECYEHIEGYGPTRASEVYNKLLQMDPSRTDATFNLGRLHYQQKQYRQALVYFDRIPDSDPRALEARTLAAKACRDQQDYATAITYAKRAYHFKQHPDVMHFLGLQYTQLGEVQEATHWFNKAVETDPKHVGSLSELGQLMFKQGRLQEAELHLSKVHDIDRANIAVLKRMAQIRFQLKKFDKCRQCCDSILRLEPLNGEALFLLAEMQKQSPAEESWFVDIRSPAEVTKTDVAQVLAKAYLARNRPKEGLPWLQKAQQCAPSDPRLREAVRLLTQPGASNVNPKDVLDILDRTFYAATRWSPGEYDAETRRGPDLHAKAASEQVESSIDLDKLLRRAERAGDRGGDSASRGVGGGAGQELWQEVLAAAKSLLRKNPDDAAALKAVARSLIATGGDFDEIREYARRAVDKSKMTAGSIGLGYEIHAYLAAAHERDRDFSVAERHYAAALSSKPGDEAAQLGLARNLLQRGDTVKARQLYEQACNEHPTCSEAHRRLGDLALKAGEYTDAYHCSSKATKLDSDDHAAFLCLGHACVKLNRPDEAVRAFEQGLAKHHTDADSMRALAELHKQAGRDQDAILWFRRLLDLRPGDYACSLSLADLHASRGAAGASQALHFYRSALQNRPSSKETRAIYIKMTNVQCVIKSWKDAQQLLEGATREFPDDVELWSKLGTVYMHLQDEKGQQACNQRLAQLNSKAGSSADFAQQLAYGARLESQDKLREARDQYEQVLRSDPGNEAALLKLANLLKMKNQFDEARKLFDQVLLSSPSNVEALEGAAYCYRKAENWDMAMQRYLDILKVEPQAERPLFYLGDILYRQYRFAECQHYLTRLAEVDASPEYKRGGLYILSRSHVSLDEYEEAEQHLRSGLAQGPNAPHFLIMLALVKHRVAEYDESISILGQALQNIDNAEGEQQRVRLKVEIHDMLAQAYERKKEYSTAMEKVEAALSLDQKYTSAWNTKGLVYMYLKQYEQAESAFKHALTLERNNALALVRLGYCRLLANEPHEATQMFQRALQQRCGTVALPRSVKGVARIYMALAAIHTVVQDTKQALGHLGEARKNHTNFRKVCERARDLIMANATDSLAKQLQVIPDVDVNSAQAWQLVMLLVKETHEAEELKVGPAVTSAPVVVPPGGSGLGGGPKVPSTMPQSSASRSGQADLGPRVAPRDGTGKAGYSPISLLPSSGALTPPGGYPATTPPSSSKLPFDRPGAPAATTTPPPEAGRKWFEPEAPVVSPAPTQERRQWTASSAASPGPLPQQPARGGPPPPPTLRDAINVAELKQAELVGSGGFGAVYRGYYRDQEVAIKKLYLEDGVANLSELQLEELEKEVAALRSLSHERLVRFIGASLEPPNLCIVTEFQPGGSLHNLLHKAKTPLVPSQRSRLALQVGEGVAFLHGSEPPMVHRDLKSMNIVLGNPPEYNAKICDFGLTQSMGNRTHISLKDAGGSPRYMAPECYDSSHRITVKVDVWALGCLLVEIFGGPLPYDECQSQAQIIHKLIIERQPPTIPEDKVSPGVRAVIKACLELDVKARTTSQEAYKSLQDLRRTGELADVS